MNLTTPKGMRLHIGIFGRRNVGKSSIVNALCNQQVSIVSPRAGTTTDPVEKPMELLPLGPVIFIDTAGIDDCGALGALRNKKTRSCLDRVDLAMIITSHETWGPFEQDLAAELHTRGIPAIAVHNKQDQHSASGGLAGVPEHMPLVFTSAVQKNGIDTLRAALIEYAPEGYFDTACIAADLLAPEELALLVVPIDKEAPRGRLILPQVQTLRDLLDNGRCAMVVREHELTRALALLQKPPALIITDSQAFEQVAALAPPQSLLTGFSILLARNKADLATLVLGARAVDRLKKGDRILIAESCTHHPIEDDIGRVKIPRWMERYVGAPLHFTTVAGHDFPDDLAEYRLVIHCGGCMHTRRAVLQRLEKCRRAGVPITNYGLAIAKCLGMLERALGPFPEALELYRGA
jgi:[FeFe] hydrogenase H-cluster maturation GTPase HydF